MNNQFDYTPQGNDPFVNNVFDQPQKPTGHAKGYSIASLILGICAVCCTCLCCCLYYVTIVLSVLSIVMAFLAKRDNGGKMPGMAIAGLIFAIIGVLLFVLMMSFEIYLNSIPEDQLNQRFREFLESMGIDYDEFMAAYEAGYDAGAAE